MKQLLLLFALECYALTLPSSNNLAIWNEEENWEIEKASIISFRYSEPFKGFYNGKLDFVWSDGHFLTTAGFGSASLDSIYRELEFSGGIGFKPFNFLSFRLSETATILWIPEYSSWQEHKILSGVSFFYKNWAKVLLTQKTYLVSKTPADFSWLLACETNFALYSFGAEFPINVQNEISFRIYQKVTLGYFGIYNSFAYPGPTLGFGFSLSISDFLVGVGHLRAGYPDGHTGYVGKIDASK